MNYEAMNEALERKILTSNEFNAILECEDFLSRISLRLENSVEYKKMVLDREFKDGKYTKPKFDISFEEREIVLHYRGELKEPIEWENEATLNETQETFIQRLKKRLSFLFPT